MTQYALERDFQRYVPEIESRIVPLRRVTAWAVNAGSVYKAYLPGSVQVCYVDGNSFGAAEANLGAVDGAGKWFHDTATDTMYVYLATDPNESRVEAGELG